MENMTHQNPDDLRVKKNRQAIHKTFARMICEMEYDQITIKELTTRAQINRKTFYLHYPSLDSLLNEMQKELMEGFSKLIESFDGVMDISDIARTFFLYTADHDFLKERILCGGAYHATGEKVAYYIMDQNRKIIENDGQMNAQTQKIVAAYLTAGMLEVYRQWVIDGRKIPVEKMIEIVSRLISRGIDGLAGND
jgi:AcrR family transcriptional regulator